MIGPDGQTTIDMVDNKITGEKLLITTLPDRAAVGGFTTRRTVLPSPAMIVELTKQAYVGVADLLTSIRNKDDAGKIINSIKLTNTLYQLGGNGGAANDVLFEVREAA